MDIELLEKYRKQMGENAFWKYVNRVYRKATLLHSNESFTISEVCAEETEPLFRDLLTAVINMHPGEYLFSDDYTRFKKTDTNGLEAARKIRANAYRNNVNRGDGQASQSSGIRPQTIHSPGANLPDKKSIPQSGLRSGETKVRAS